MLGLRVNVVGVRLTRARRSERFAWALYFTTAACMAYVIAMYFSGIGDSLAAYHDAGRAAVAMGVFALYAMGVAIYHRKARLRTRRFLELRRNLTTQPVNGKSL